MTRNACRKVADHSVFSKLEDKGGEAEAEADVRVPNPDPDLEAAISASAEGHRFLIVGHYPKAFSVPASRRPKCVISTTGVFRGVWSLAEDKVGIRTLEVRAEKFDDPPRT